MLPAVTCRFDVSAEIRALNLATDALRTDAPGHLRRGYERAARRYLRFLLGWFDTGGRGTWAALKAATIAAKGHAKKLVERGRLRLSLIPGNPGNVLIADPNGVTVGTSDPNAEFHQSGTATIPARPIVVPPDPATDAGMAQDVADGVTAMLNDKLGRAA